MKTKFLLMLIVLTGMGWSANSASAYTATAAHSSNHLSQTMAELIGFDRDTYSLLEVAIDRALVAQAKGVPIQPTTAGAPIPTNASPTKKQPEIRGKIAVPSQPAIGQTKTKKIKPKSPVKPSATKNSSRITVGLFY
jgi:hypothetical protein